MNKKLLIGIIVVAVLVGIGGIFWPQSKKEEVKQPGPKPEITLVPEVEAVLDKKIKLISEFVKDPIIIDAVKKSNEKNKNLSLNEILRLDKKWIDTKGVDDWIKSFITNEVGLKLIEFQENNFGFSEIFIADAYGLIVGETNKTSDYYQADESWWVDSYAGGEGKAYCGGIEFDESSQTESIPVYVPVIDSETNRAIGTVKAVVDILAIKMEL